MTVTFTVIGVPAPQGSKNQFGAEANPRTKPWRAAVAAEAAVAGSGYLTQRGGALLSESVKVHARFYFPRPKSHYRTGKNAHELKPNAPLYCSTVPDLDKLQRAIGDALKGVLLRDDSLIVHWDSSKFYGSPARAQITVEAA